MKAQSSLVMKNVSYKYTNGNFELKSININTSDKPITCLLGNSGCGKSTVLNLIMGLEKPTTGTIFVGDKCLNNGKYFVAPEDRNIGVVFQHASLFPHKTVIENIIFAVKNANQAMRKSIAMDVLEIFNLGKFANSYPHMLSGGQQQMVTIARSIAQNPRIILMDEPFSSLDFTLRRTTGRAVFSMLRMANTQVIFVTHDPKEAMENADYIYIIDGGVVIRDGSPNEIYSKPCSKYVMDLFSEVTSIRAVVKEDGLIETPFGCITAPNGIVPKSNVEVCFRDDAFSIMDSGTVAKVEGYSLIDKYVHVSVESLSFRVAFLFRDAVPTVGSNVKIALNYDNIFVFPL